MATVHNADGGDAHNPDKHLSTARQQAGAPTKEWVATPSDSIDEPRYFSRVKADVGGVVAVVALNGDVVNYTLTTGQELMMYGKRINSTNTAATGITLRD